jgi:CheY-like chemotaxis protein
VKNAIKFTEKGDVTVLVERSDGHLRLEVHDTGIGIPEHDLPKLFKEFSQLEHTTAQNLEGTGLGLSITKKLTEMLGGSIGVTSRLGVGSVFWVKIPLGVASASEPNETVNNVPVPPSLPKGRRVLLVEDNIINQHAFKVMLGRMGCEVTAVNNGEQAVNTFEPGRFDLIFMDIQMPVMDGIEASERIRAKGIAPPIIGLSGNVLERDADGKLKVEMDDLLIKPVTSQELQRKLEQWAGHN